MRDIDSYLRARFEKKGVPNVVVNGGFDFNQTKNNTDYFEHFDIKVFEREI